MAKEQFVDIQTGKVTVQDAKDITYTAPKVDNVLPQLRRIRNGILAQSDWIVIKEREEGGSVSNLQIGRSIVKNFVILLMVWIQLKKY